MDRYQEIVSPKLADSLVEFCTRWLIGSDAVRPLWRKPVPTARYLSRAIRAFRHTLKSANYEYEADRLGPGEVGVAPLIGFGKKNIHLNRCVIRLLRSVSKKAVICIFQGMVQSAFSQPDTCPRLSGPTSRYPLFLE